jgi:acyl dehydratase
MSAFADRPFEALEIGDRAASRARTITESDVAQFANLTWDVHPLHTDAVSAAQGPFGTRVAHGMLVLSFAIGLLPLSPRFVLGLRRVHNAVFKAPVVPGDTISAAIEIVEMSELDDVAGLVAVRLRVRDSAQSIAMVATLECLWARAARLNHVPLQAKEH